MAKRCINHPDQYAVTMCHGCHKPLCKACVIVTARGSFCTPECGALYQRMKAKLAGVREKIRTAQKIALALLLIVLAVMALHFVARSNPSLRKFDILGRFIGYSDFRSGGR